jgi:hypothetical protein
MQKKLVRKTTTTVEEFLEDEGEVQGAAQGQREDEEDDGREADDADVPAGRAAGRGGVVPKSTQNPGRQRIRS